MLEVGSFDLGHSAAFRVGHVEALRELGMNYKDMEDSGIMLPVYTFSIKYMKPAFYDDEITVVTYIREKPTGLRINFEYECFNPAEELINTGKVTLVMLDKATNKMCKIPDWFQNAFNPFF